MLTQEKLKSLLRYDPETGVFTRLQKAAHNAGGGTVNRLSGYRTLSVEGKLYYAHRLAFLYMTGAWPEHQADHINGDREDNRWSNLRDATPLVNQQNLVSAQSNNCTGFLGVSYAPKRRGEKKYVAQLFANGKRRHCTYHETPEAAHAAYLVAKRQLHEGNTL
jgi:hypothetical protein